MARQKKTLTEEEKLEQQKLREINSINTDYSFLHAPTPTYFFNVGDEVQYGALISSVVEEIFNDGKVYLLRCVCRDNNYGKPFDYTAYRAVCWYQIRPTVKEMTNLTKKNDVNIIYYNSSVESLLHRYYCFGVDMNPEYQRGYVWSLEDKQKLIESIFEKADIGKFTFIKLTETDYIDRDVDYEILDGKQRLSTLTEFYENRFSYKGKFYNDLDGCDKRTFLNAVISIGDINNVIDRKTIYQQFLRINRTGKPIPEEHLKRIEMLSET
jgi:hypothetical protein